MAKGSHFVASISEHHHVQSNLDLIETWLTAKLAYERLPGTTVGVVHDQELVYARGFGFADIDSGAAMTEDSIFRIASHSKLFTAISIMQLRDAGQLGLDDHVSDYLPWFQINDQHPESPPITVRHLLTHTSGLPREAGSSYWLDFDFPSLDIVKDRLPGQQTIFPTETQWKYSNLALTIAGEVVAAVSGKPFQEYVPASILAPLGMESTSVVFPGDHVDRLVTGYRRKLPNGERDVFPFVDAEGMAAATGLSSTVADMARFVSWQFRLLGSDNTEILKASTLREMQRPHWVQPDWQSGWGIGFGIQRLAGRTLVGHGGGYPGYLTSTRICPEEKLGVIVFTNSLDSRPEAISDRIFEWLSPAVSLAASGADSEPVPDAWAGYTGTYRNLWGDSHVQALDGQLRMFDPTSPNPKPDALTLEPAGEHSFTIKGKGAGPLGERVFFDVDASGQARRVKIADGWSNRVSYDDRVL